MHSFQQIRAQLPASGAAFEHNIKESQHFKAPEKMDNSYHPTFSLQLTFNMIFE